MKTLSLSEAKMKLSELVDKVQRLDEEVIITRNGRPAAVEAVLSVDVDTARSELTINIAAASIVEIARFLHDDPMACFDHLTDICSADYPDAPQRFEVIYQLLSLPRGKRIIASRRGSTTTTRPSTPSPESGAPRGSWNGKSTT